MIIIIVTGYINTSHTKHLAAELICVTLDNNKLKVVLGGTETYFLPERGIIYTYI